MSGLSDEAGAAMPLAMASKQLGLPVDTEISRLEAYIHETLFPGNGSEPGKHQFVQVQCRHQFVQVQCRYNAGTVQVQCSSIS